MDELSLVQEIILSEGFRCSAKILLAFGVKMFELLPCVKSQGRLSRISLAMSEVETKKKMDVVNDVDDWRKFETLASV